MTERAEDSAVYWDALLDYDVDLVVREPGQSVGRDMALSIRAWSRSLYGDGQTREEVLAYMAVPTYEEARKLLTLADENLALAQQAEDEFFRDQRYRGAFDTLFNAARYAAMTLRAEPQGEAWRGSVNSTCCVSYTASSSFPRQYGKRLSSKALGNQGRTRSSQPPGLRAKLPRTDSLCAPCSKTWMRERPRPLPWHWR